MKPNAQMKKLEGQIQRQVQRDFAHLELVRNEIRSMVGRAGEDAQAKWLDLERQLHRFQARATLESNHVADETWALARELRQTLEEFKARL